MHLPLLLTSGLLCLALPLVGFAWLRRVVGVEPRAALALVGGGALVFLGSQLVHVPLNLVGLGHGGVEAVLVGLTVLSSAVGLLDVRLRGIDALGLPPKQAALVADKLAELDAQPAIMMLMGAAERTMATSCHLSMSLLVMRAVRERRSRWLLASIALYTLLNAGALALVRAGSPLGAEAFVLFVVFGSLGLVAALREGS